MDGITKECYEYVNSSIIDLKNSICYCKKQNESYKVSIMENEGKIEKYKAQILVYERMLKAVGEDA